MKPVPNRFTTGVRAKNHVGVLVAVLVLVAAACTAYDRAEYARRLDGSTDVAADVSIDVSRDAASDTTGDVASLDADDVVATETAFPDNRLDDARDVLDPLDVPPVDVAILDAPPADVPACRSNIDCDDRDPCTTDACVAGTGPSRCTHTPVDADMDSYPAAMVGTTACAGGNDCADSIPAVHPGATESCNMRDDDCNGWVDDATSCHPSNELCTTATRVTLSTPGPPMVIRASNLGSVGGTVISACAPMTIPDIWYDVSYPGTFDLRIDVVGTSPRVDPIVTVMDACATGGGFAEACDNDVSSTDRSARLWIRADPSMGFARRVFVAVGTPPTATGNFEVRFQLLSAVAGLNCSSPPFDVSEGGAVYGPGGNRGGSMRPSCSISAIGLAEQIHVYSGPISGPLQISWVAYGYAPSVFARDASCAVPVDAFCDRTMSGTRAVTVSRVPFWFGVDGGGDVATAYLLTVRRP